MSTGHIEIMISYVEKWKAIQVEMDSSNPSGFCLKLITGHTWGPAFLSVCSSGLDLHILQGFRGGEYPREGMGIRVRLAEFVTYRLWDWGTFTRTCALTCFICRMPMILIY
jgi:hypothetical protein